MARGRYIGDHYWEVDRRVNTNDKPKAKMDKYDNAKVVWREAYPDVEFPHYFGSAFHAYKTLEEVGYKFSSRYGWRKR